MKNILVIPVGDIEMEILEQVSFALKNTFGCKVEISKGISLPYDAFNAERRQYHSSIILKKIKSLKPDDYNHAIGIVDVDLYVPELNFVFGEADIYSKIAAVISLTRLRQEFYGYRPDRELFLQRTIKEAIHEIGHIYCLGHCKKAKCIMYFSNTIRDTDNKGPDFCDSCRKKLNLQPV